MKETNMSTHAARTLGVVLCVCSIGVDLATEASGSETGTKALVAEIASAQSEKQEAALSKIRKLSRRQMADIAVPLAQLLTVSQPGVQACASKALQSLGKQARRVSGGSLGRSSLLRGDFDSALNDNQLYLIGASHLHAKLRPDSLNEPISSADAKRSVRILGHIKMGLAALHFHEASAIRICDEYFAIRIQENGSAICELKHRLLPNRSLIRRADRQVVNCCRVNY